MKVVGLLASCRFKTTIKYRDGNTGKYVPYVCHEPEENILETGLCIFRSEDYLKDPKNMEVNKQNIKGKLTEKIENSEPLICIEYYIPDFSFKQLHFDKSVNFSGTVFTGLADFSDARFTAEADFIGTRFTERADFSDARFTGSS